MEEDKLKKITRLIFIATIVQVLVTLFTLAVLLIILFLVPPNAVGRIFYVVIFAVSSVINVAFSYADYKMLYKNLKAGNYSNLSNTMLILGILQLVFSSVISGIPIIIAWVQMKE